MARKAAAKPAAKKASTKAPKKAPADKFIVVRDSCQNVMTGQLETKAEATKRARDYARDCQGRIRYTKS